MKILISLIFMTYNNFSSIAFDFEKALGYNPKKIEYISANNPEYNFQIADISHSIFEFYPGIFIKADKDHYIIYQKNEKLLYKFYSSLADISDVITNDFIPRKVTYRYISTNNKIITINGFQETESILNNFSNGETLNTSDSLLFKLSNGFLLERADELSSYCVIYSDIETYNQRFKFKEFPEIDYNSLFNYSENIKKLESVFHVKFNVPALNKEDLYLLSTSCFDYVKSFELEDLYPHILSFYMKFVEDNYGSIKRFEINGESIPIVELNNSKFDIARTVYKTIENIKNYEFNPNRYFILLDLDY